MALSTASPSASAAVAMASSIPCFLLPRRGPMWQQQGLAVAGILQRRPTTAASATAPASGCIVAAAWRHASSARSSRWTPPSAPSASSTAPSPPPPSPSAVLEKPAKFNPPSHGSRLPRKGAAARAPPSLHYGGELSPAERQAQRLRQYPGTMAPPGTWSHWFWNSRALHMGITMTALTILAIYTFLENFRRSSPFVDMLPTAAQALRHPILAVRTAVEVFRLTEDQRIAEISEKRQRRIDDVSKRTMYRKAHGLEETVGFNSGWLTGGVKKEGPTAPARNEEAPALSPVEAVAAAAAATQSAVDDASPVHGVLPLDGQAGTDAAGTRKRFLGIF